MGLRAESSPFDWNITDFRGVIKAIENHFEGYLEYDNLYQSSAINNLYRNINYNVTFFHDFSHFIPLKDQLSDVQIKYDRRIARFYQSISEPTIFIRYIWDKKDENGNFSEVVWIENNYEQIITLLKQFNEKNEIVFIANEGVSSTVFPIYTVKKHQNDSVSRTPIQDNPALYEKLNSLPCTNREQNIELYKAKVRKKSRITEKIKYYFNKFYSHVRKKYIHDKRY